MEQTFQTTVQKQGSRVFIILPFDPNQSWGTKERHNVHGAINGVRIRGPLVVDQGSYHLALGPAWRRDSGIAAGMTVTVQLEAEGPQVERMAADLNNAFTDAPKALAFFQALPTFYQKNYMRWVESAKRPETRAKRIEEMIELLKAGKREKEKKWSRRQKMNELFKKLQYKGSDKILVLQAPDEFQPHLAAIADQVRIDTQTNGDETYDFVMVFVKSCAEVQANAAPVVNRVKEDALLWFAYPKKSSKKYKTDLGRDDGWQPLGALGYEGVRIIAIDEDWSAFRLRHVRNIKSLTRSERMALSEEGKQRAKQG